MWLVVAYVLGGIAAVGMFYTAIVVNHRLAKQIKKDSEAWDRVYRHKEGVRKHEALVDLERSTFVSREYPSGRTVTDNDGVVHSVPAGFFAITMCELEIRPSNPTAEDPIDRYPYDPAGIVAATCLECLGRETAC